MKVHMDAKIPHPRYKSIYLREVINDLNLHLILPKGRDLQKHHICHLSALTRISAKTEALPLQETFSVTSLKLQQLICW